MVNSEFVKDIKKGLDKVSIGQEFPPGAPRRYEPECGVNKHNERVHRESRYADHYKNLPFTFSKPPKPKGRSTYIVCDNCGQVTNGTTATVGIVCENCKKFSTVTEINDREG